MFELSLLLDRFLIFRESQMDKTWNQFTRFGITILRSSRIQFQEIKENYQKSAVKNILEQIFM